MKKILMAVPFMAILGSCLKEPTIDPVAGYNSQLNFNNIQISNSTNADSIKAFIYFKFYIANDTSSIPDTSKFLYSFNITSISSNQMIQFNTPAKTKVANFDVNVTIYGGSADGIHVDEFSYQKDGQTLLSNPLDFQYTVDHFTTPTITYHF